MDLFTSVSTNHKAPLSVTNKRGVIISVIKGVDAQRGKVVSNSTNYRRVEGRINARDERYPIHNADRFETERVRGRNVGVSVRLVFLRL